MTNRETLPEETNLNLDQRDSANDTQEGELSDAQKRKEYYTQEIQFRMEIVNNFLSLLPDLFDIDDNQFRAKKKKDRDDAWNKRRLNLIRTVLNGAISEITSILNHHRNGKNGLENSELQLVYYSDRLIADAILNLYNGRFPKYIDQQKLDNLINDLPNRFKLWEDSTNKLR